jgi:hypothetical protein
MTPNIRHEQHQGCKPAGLVQVAVAKVNTDQQAHARDRMANMRLVLIKTVPDSYLFCSTARKQVTIAVHDLSASDREVPGWTI